MEIRRGRMNVLVSSAKLEDPPEKELNVIRINRPGHKGRRKGAPRKDDPVATAGGSDFSFNDRRLHLVL
jgi:hypothetical protein